jgi:hypothetical protein
MLVSRCDAPALARGLWAFSNGPEWPGSTGSLTAASDRAAALTLSYNFSGQPTSTRGYVAADFFHGASALAAVPSPIALSISVAGTAASISVRVVDAQGQSHLGDVQHNTTDGRPLVIALSSLPTHYGGPNDGVLHLPLSKVAIGVNNRGNQAGAVLLSNLSLHTRTPPAAILAAAVAPVAPYGVAFADEVRVAGGLAVRVNVTNALRTDCQFRLQFTDGDSGIILPTSTTSCGGTPTAGGSTVGGWSTTSCVCIIKNRRSTGYFPFQLHTQALGECAPVRQSTSIESALVVVDRALQPQPDASRIFGSQFFGAELASAAARLGVAHTRVQVYWRWMQRSPGTPPDMTSGSMQSTIEGAVRSNISVTLDMRAEPPDWAINSNGSAAERYAPWTLYPRPEHLPAYLLRAIQCNFTNYHMVPFSEPAGIPRRLMLQNFW